MKRYLLIPVAFLMLGSLVFAGPMIFRSGGGGGGGSGDLLADGSVPLTANWAVGAYYIQGTQ